MEWKVQWDSGKVSHFHRNIFKNEISDLKLHIKEFAESWISRLDELESRQAREVNMMKRSNSKVLYSYLFDGPSSYPWNIVYARRWFRNLMFYQFVPVLLNWGCSVNLLAIFRQGHIDREKACFRLLHANMFKFTHLMIIFKPFLKNFWNICTVLKLLEALKIEKKWSKYEILIRDVFNSGRCMIHRIRQQCSRNSLNRLHTV